MDTISFYKNEIIYNIDLEDVCYDDNIPFPPPIPIIRDDEYKKYLKYTKDYAQWKKNVFKIKPNERNNSLMSIQPLAPLGAKNNHFLLFQNNFTS